MTPLPSLESGSQPLTLQIRKRDIGSVVHNEYFLHPFYLRGAIGCQHILQRFYADRFVLEELVGGLGFIPVLTLFGNAAAGLGGDVLNNAHKALIAPGVTKILTWKSSHCSYASLSGRFIKKSNFNYITPNLGKGLAPTGGDKVFKTHNSNGPGVGVTFQKDKDGFGSGKNPPLVSYNSVTLHALPSKGYRVDTFL
jgi:hypothetical protein